MQALKWVIIGRISGLYGIKGWIKVFSYTEPRTDLLDYSPLYLGSDNSWREVELETGRSHGKGIVLKLIGYDDRSAAVPLIGQNLAIRYHQLPELEDGEVYWADLEGMSVATLSGVNLGVVDSLFATGANDVIVVKGDRERLIPFLRDQVVRNIDHESGTITVDWDPEF